MGYFEYIFEVGDFEYTPLLFAHLWSNPVGSLKRSVTACPGGLFKILSARCFKQCYTIFTHSITLHKHSHLPNSFDGESDTLMAQPDR